MKKRNNLGIIHAARVVVALALGSSAILALAQDEKVTLKEGKVLVLEGSQARPLTETLELTSAIQVYTNGTFAVHQGEPRKLEEGQVLDQEGMLTSPNGTIRPVLDHLVQRQGKVILCRDGKESVLQTDLMLPTGVRVRPNGTLQLPNGMIRRLIDGQILKLDGTTLPSYDTATLRDGQVYVQKNGSQFTVDAKRFIVMNDGTKVYGTGKILKPSGDTLQLKEGQIVQIQGIVAPR